jgi:REP element-mobilizing transposase RayT
MFAHIVWPTWRRVGCIDAATADNIKLVALRVGKRTGVQVIAAAVLAEHVHFLVSFRPDTKLSDFVRLVKTNSSFEANRRITGSLKWGRGYYVTTIHKNDVGRVQRYVEHQFDRHPDRIPRGSPKQVL